MVKLNKIYTRTGDKGDTGIASGQRLPKHDIRIEASGTVDEANSAIGIARLHDEAKTYDLSLKRIQHDMFDLGADLSTVITRKNDDALRITDKQVERLEQEMDVMNEWLTPLDSFVLPGGSPLAAHLHMARAIVRRAERVVCALAEKETINPAAILYLNRLSDFLFVLARVANNKGASDVLWEPGVNR